MRRSLQALILGFAAMAIPGPALGADRPAFEWKDGDRVISIGDTMVERDQKHGYLETRITAANPSKAIVFRNLGWSGDTVHGHARAGFGTTADGFKLLKDHVNALKPTVLIVGYGMAESFEGEAGLPRFVSGMNTMLDAVTGSKPRLIFLSPIGHENLGRPLPDPSAHNRSIKLYRDAIKKIADERSGWFIDLFDATEDARVYGIGPLTENGIHPTPFGHWYFASVIDEDLRGPQKARGWSVRTNNKGELVASLAKISGSRTTGDGASFDLIDDALPPPPIPASSPADAASLATNRVIRLGGLDAGRYVLAIDGRKITQAGAQKWKQGVTIDRGPDFNQVEALRAAIVAKNELYFYRWRPQNETYLFGFRKHEQGNNAREIPLFDPLVEAKETEIAGLRQPKTHAYKLTRESEDAK